MPVRPLGDSRESELDVQSREAVDGVRCYGLHGVAFGPEPGVADGVAGASSEIGPAPGAHLRGRVDDPALTPFDAPFAVEVADGLVGVVGDDVDVAHRRDRGSRRIQSTSA